MHCNNDRRGNGGYQHFITKLHRRSRSPPTSLHAFSIQEEPPLSDSKKPGGNYHPCRRHLLCATDCPSTPKLQHKLACARTNYTKRSLDKKSPRAVREYDFFPLSPLRRPPHLQIAYFHYIVLWMQLIFCLYQTTTAGCCCCSKKKSCCCRCVFLLAGLALLLLSMAAVRGHHGDLNWFTRCEMVLAR